jgi:flavorubredoxin
MMMKENRIKKDIIYVGAPDAERRIFDELIPLPDGTTYNSYLIKGSEKTVLIDSVDPAKKDVLFANLDKAGVEKIDYIVAQHGEQDHSGSIPFLLQAYPMAKVVTNSKCKAELMDLLLIDESKFIVIEDGQEISTGNKTLRFIFTPWVHWPETMSTYIPEDKILFSCDFFGSHLAKEKLYPDSPQDIYIPAKRYFAEIMSPFRSIIRKNLEKIGNLDIEIIAPSHGPLLKGKDFIFGCYKDWASDTVKNEVLIAYVSMHGSTEKITGYFIGALEKRKITVRAFNLADADIGEIAMALVDAATAVIGSPTVLAGTHPKAIFAAFLVKALRPKTKYLSVIGSYGWGGKMVEQLADMLGSVGAEILEPVLVKGFPKEADFKMLDNLADKILQKHTELGLI